MVCRREPHAGSWVTGGRYGLGRSASRGQLMGAKCVFERETRAGICQEWSENGMRLPFGHRRRCDLPPLSTVAAEQRPDDPQDQDPQGSGLWW